MRFTARLIVLLSLCSALGTVRAVAAPPRNIQVRWDFRRTAGEELQIWVDCQHTSTDHSECTDAGHVIASLDAYSFELKRSDRVTLVAVAGADDDPGFVEYAVTGTNLDEKDLDQLKKLLTGAASGASAAKNAVQVTEATLPEPRFYPKAVTDPLVAGGKLTVTFSLKKKEGTGKDEKETVTKTSGPLTFNVHQDSPRVTVSAGLGFSTAPNPTVAIVKTATIVSFTKDGKDQQAYQQVITLKDTDTTLRPVQSLMTLANFRLYCQWYATVGFRVDEKIFEQPVLGVTYRHAVGTRTGLNFTAGTMFSRETEILKDSGFYAGQIVDPTLGLTTDEIPTKNRYHHRLAFMFSVDF